jgi:glycosyltransferase involved in cell wall biosynthesis
MSRLQCDLKRVDRRHLACSRCGRVLVSPEGGPAVAAICKVEAAGAAAADRLGPSPDWWPKDADGLVIPQGELTAADMPCPYRGELLRADLPCELCGLQHERYDVYACSEHGECSLVPRTKGNKLLNCLKCTTRRDALAKHPAFPLGTLPVVTRPANKQPGPIRVAILTPDLGAGGAERWIASLVKYLPSKQAIVTAVGVVMDGQKWDAIAREITSAGTPVYGTRKVRWGIRPTDASTITYVETDAEVTRKTLAGADVVVSWGISGVGRLLESAGWRGPHVIVSHGSSAWARNQLLIAAPQATHCVAVSSDAAKAFPQGIKAEVIWNGSELERLAPTRSAAEVRESWGCTADQLLVGYVGRLSPEKNPLAVAHLVHALRRRMPDRDIRPVWIGTGLEDAASKIKRDALSLAGAKNVWVPPPAHIGDAYQALDLHVMASPEEGFSLVVTEALVAGVPTVATPVGIVPDLLSQWGNVVVPVAVGADGEQLADAAEVALSEEHAANVRRARHVVWEEFTAAKMGSRWADYLRQITMA